MSDNSPNFTTSLISYASEDQEERRRAYAVDAALQLIHAKMVGGSGDGGNLSREINSLSTYADKIEEALNKTN